MTDAPLVVHEWRVTGQPDGDYPPYEFVYRSNDNRWLGQSAERAASAFIAKYADMWSVIELAHRTITYGQWLPAAPATERKRLDG